MFPTWVQIKDGQVWLMCDACRDQQRGWFVQALGTEAGMAYLTELNRQHLETHGVLAVSNEVSG